MTDTIHFVHTADWHMGSPFGTWPDRAAQLQQEQLAAFSRLIDTCAREKPDLLLIAGDLFDRTVPDAPVVHWVREQLDAIPDTRVFISAGNHDPAFLDSPYRALPWPANVHCFTDELSSYDLPDRPVRVMGAGFTSGASPRSLLPEANGRPASDASVGSRTVTPTDSRLRLLVLHGDVVSQGQGSPYNPITMEQFIALGIDYAALGHRHERSGPLPAGRGRFAYSGCPMGRGFDETGEKGYLRLEMALDPSTDPDQSRPFRADWIPLGARPFVIQPIPVDSCRTTDDLATRIGTDMSRLHGADWTGMACRIVLTGHLPDELAVVPSVLVRKIAPDGFLTELADQTAPLWDLDAWRIESSLRGTFIRLLENPDMDDRSKRALDLGLSAFCGEVPERAYP